MKTQRRASYHSMSLLALLAGTIGLALHLLPGMAPLSFMVSLAAVGGLIGGRGDYTETERQQLLTSFKTAFEAQLLVIMAAYFFIVVAGGLPLFDAASSFLNAQWPSLVIALMCLLLGLAGLRHAKVTNMERRP